jgi:hypothetical protein
LYFWIDTKYIIIYRHTRRVGLYSYADLQNKNKELLLICGPKTEVEENEKLLLSQYHLFQKILVVIHSKTI